MNQNKLNLGYKVFLWNIIEDPKLAEYMFDALDKHFSYVEFYVRPGDIDRLTPELAKRIANYNVIIHAPHSGDNFDPSLTELSEKKANHALLQDAFIAAELFHAKQVVYHGGAYHGEDSLQNNIDFINEIPDRYKKLVALENVPFYNKRKGKPDRKYAVSSPEEIETVLKATGVQFCFDFSHGVCAAISAGLDPMEQIKKYVKLNPDMFHICDGLLDVDTDLHFHFGVGEFPLEELLKMTNGKPVSLETGNSVPKDCYAQIQDCKKAKEMYYR